MTGWTEVRDLFLKAFPSIPSDLREGYQVDAQNENARRLKILGFIIAFVAIVMLFLQFLLGHQNDPVLNQLCIWSCVAVIVMGLLSTVTGHNTFVGKWDIRPISFSIIIQFITIAFVSWAFSISVFSPFGAFSDWIYLGVVFIVMSLLLFSLTEVIFVSIVILIIQALVARVRLIQLVEIDEYMTLAVVALIVAVVLSRILYFSRIRNFLNWENINQMNLTLKREISMHLETTRDLQKIRKDLDKKVHTQTRDLREANQRLSEEIAERRFADKVRTILYRISTFVSHNHNLETIFEYMHQQLGSIVEAKNLLIYSLNSSNNEFTSIYKSTDPDDFLAVQETEAFIINLLLKHRCPILLQKEELESLINKRKFDVNLELPQSCIAIPLMIEDSLLGLMMVQSYRSSSHLDQTDLELLEYVSEHMTIALAREENHQKLIQAKERAEESDRLKSRFLANMSHEIRTPMNAIVGFSELIGNYDLTEDERKYYSTQVIRSSNYLLQLISNIIELSKLQSGEAELKREDLSVVDSIRNFEYDCQTLKEALDCEDLFVKYEVDEALVDERFTGNQEAFKQIMSCLVENAFKFTNEGGVTIGAEGLDNQFVKFYVSDTGIGIDETEIHEIFNYFRQGAMATHRLYRGTGLGLGLAKALVEELGGSIWAESELDKGSRFCFTLKLNRHIPTLEMHPANEDDSPSKSTEINTASAG